MSEIKGYIDMPFHGESAYDIAVRLGYEGSEEEWIREMVDISDGEMKDIMDNFSKRLCGYTWFPDTDTVKDKSGTKCGSLGDCMTEDFVGAWFFVRTSTSESGSCTYPEKYSIDGANGYLSLRDYVVWTGARLVHIPTFEAKSSNVKNSDGKYSPKSGVDGLMSSTDKAYLTDLINSFWGKESFPFYKDPDPVEGWMVNWCRNDGIYLGGFKKYCGGHPPVVNENYTSWVLLVFNGMNMSDGNRNHRLQIAFDVQNSKVYMRRGWMSTDEWAEWSEVSRESDVLFVKESGTVALTENVKEVVFFGEVDADVLYPENDWLGWRCVLNFVNADHIKRIDVGTHDEIMFGEDGGTKEISAGKTVMVVKIDNATPVSPSNYTLFQIDNVTREKI